MQQFRRIVFYKKYFLDFFAEQPEDVKKKIDQVLFVITIVDKIPGKFFRHLQGTEGLYEIRVEFRGNIYRIFCCFDEGKIIVLFNGFQKKANKTPTKEIERANNIKSKYLKDKINGNKR